MTKLLTASTINQALVRRGRHLKKSLGQHFLADPNTARKIVELAGINPGDKVIEIGPGAGSLTIALLDAGALVSAVEIDEPMTQVLMDLVGTSTALRVINADAMEFDFGQLDATKLVANLPYNIATSLVINVLQRSSQISQLLVMVQKEVAQRWVAAPRTSAYGSPSVKIQYFARARIVGSVSPSVFVPPPKVESSLVSIERHRTIPECRTEALFDLVNAGFGKRRKMLRQSLKSACVNPEGVLHGAGVSPTARAEELGILEWLALANAVDSE